MSTFLVACDAIRDHLRSVPDFEEIGIETDRQSDLLAQVNRALSNKRGAGIVVSWAGSKNTDTKSSSLMLKSRYTVAVMFVPVLKKGHIPADTIMEIIIHELHQRKTDDSNPCGRWLKFLDCSITEANHRFTIAELRFELTAKSVRPAEAHAQS